MKEFIKYVCATLVAMVLMGVVTVGFVLLVIIGIAAADTNVVADKSVLVLSLSGSITEQSQDETLTSLIGDDEASLSLHDILLAINTAAENKDVKGIYLDLGVLSTGYSTLVSIREALATFRKTGKWVIAYSDSYTQGAYYIASIANEVYVNPSGAVDLHGIASRVMYVKDLYGKLGVRFQILKVGKYKSATEVYSEEQMSAANREQLTAVTSGIWSTISKDIARSRKIPVDTVNALADRFTAFLDPEEMMEYGLVDRLVYSDDLRDIVKDRLGVKASGSIHQLSISDMCDAAKKKTRGGTIAVYCAEGDIVDTSIASMPWSDGTSIIGDKVCADLDKLINDDDVKAVVLRVNSPGGSAYAAEQIWHRVAKLKMRKPVVVSMGDYAASGGYYISCNASWIVAQPTTITGSIGIFGIIPEASELLTKKLSLHFDGVQTHAHSDLGAGVLSLAARPLDDYETALLQEYINRGYDLFCQHVADGRGMTVEEVDNLAQGHVWLGTDARANGLVDELGGIDIAIEKAADLASLHDYHTVYYPEASSWWDSLLSSDSHNNLLNDQLHAMLQEWYAPLLFLHTVCEQQPMQARLPFFMTVD